MSRLDCIADRQRHSRLRDVVFAALVVVVGGLSISTVSHAVRAAHVELVRR